MFGRGFDSRHLHSMWDPLRRKDVASTPEEQVRQWFIGVLRSSVGVPMHEMSSEVPFSFGHKSYRADILVYDRAQKPLAVVECKRPGVALGPAVGEQALRYNSVLDVRWIFLTNGQKTVLLRREPSTGAFAPCEEIPSYEQMCLL